MKDLVEKTTKLAEAAEKHAKELEANAAKLEAAAKDFADEAEKAVLEAMKTGVGRTSDGHTVTVTKVTKSRRSFRWPWTGSGTTPEVVVEETRTTRGGDGYEVHNPKTCPDCVAHRAKKVRVELGQEELHFDGEGLMDQAVKLDVQDLLADLRKKYGEGGYRTKPLSDSELLTLIVAEQRAEIARLREDFEAHLKPRREGASVWFGPVTVALIILGSIIFLLVFWK